MHVSIATMHVVLLLGVFWIQGSAYAATCLHASGWSTGSAASYLTLDRGSQTPECTATALRRLAGPDSSPDLALLIKYIDFVRPDAGGMIVLNMGNVADLYPAVKTLAGIGAPALPVLLDFLKRPEMEDHLRRNAVRTIKLIATDDAYAIGYLFAAVEPSPGLPPGRELNRPQNGHMSGARMPTGRPVTSYTTLTLTLGDTNFESNIG